MTLFSPSPLGVIPTPPIIGFLNLNAGGPGAFISRIIGLFLIIGGLFVLFNIIIAGYLYVQGGSQNLSAAWNKIWQSLLGIIVMSAAVLITGIISWFVFGNPAYLLNPVIPTP